MFRQAGTTVKRANHGFQADAHGFQFEGGICQIWAPLLTSWILRVAVDPDQPHSSLVKISD